MIFAILGALFFVGVVIGLIIVTAIEYHHSKKIANLQIKPSLAPASIFNAMGYDDCIVHLTFLINTYPKSSYTEIYHTSINDVFIRLEQLKYATKNPTP